MDECAIPNAAAAPSTHARAAATLRAVPGDHHGSSDGDVARAVARGDDPVAESELVSRFARRVVLFGLRRLGDEGKASDLAQDVMLSVLQKLRAGEVHDPDRIGAFVLGTARWMIHDVRRRAVRRAEVEAELAAATPTAALPSEPTDLDALEVALSQLPERDRAVVVLSFQHERSSAEIATAFGLQPGHVRVIRHRAIARLAQLLREPPLPDHFAENGGDP